MARPSFQPTMRPDTPFSLEDVLRRHLDEPPSRGFDCGRDAQNRYLYDRAYDEQQQMLSATYLYYVSGILASYVTVCMDGVVLGTRERPVSIPYKQVSALKLAQLGVDAHFQGHGLGAFVVAGVFAMAGDAARQLGCRYVILDSKPDLVDWYSTLGFRINKVMQKQRIEAAAGKRNPAAVPVSMRFDLLDYSTL